MADWVKRLGGRVMVFDGPDGSGKSTQSERFAEHCRGAGVPVCEVREPGGTAIGEQIRAVLLNPANTECEAMLYMASRAQLIEECIGPALERGDLVVADRFVSSTLAYQGTAGGLTRDEIIQVAHVAIRDHWPDLTLIFDVDDDTAAVRIHGRKNARKASAAGPTLFADRVERKDADFHRRVRQGFLDQAEADPDHYLVIDATADADTVFAAVLEAIQDDCDDRVKYVGEGQTQNEGREHRKDA